MFGSIVMGLVGVALIVTGLIVWKKEKISLLHDYHYDKVTEENKKSFCALSGAGLSVMGAGLAATAVLLALTESAWNFVALAAGFAIGLLMLVYAGMKYNG